MKTSKTYGLLILLLLITFGVDAKPKVKNVILLIGDGMGINQVYAAMTANGNSLNMETCTYTGYSKTYSASGYITDSAAGATAIACGVKTNNKMVGLDADTLQVESIMCEAKHKGLSTGVVVTCPVTHATPAAFYAHQMTRYGYDKIADDLLKSNIDLFIGGGLDHFNKRKDNKNLIPEFEAKGYTIVYTEEELSSVKTGKVGALLAPIDMPIVTKRGDMLPNSTRKAIELLSQNKEGFFLMVEGSQIDYQGHNNDIALNIAETLDFDKAVGVALEFAKADKNTLVIITADHETGGMMIKNGNFKTGKVEATYNTSYHTGVLVPIFAYGPGAEQFTGIRENTSFKAIFESLLHISPLKKSNSQ